MKPAAINEILYPHWWALIVQPGCEQRVAERLTDPTLEGTIRPPRYAESLIAYWPCFTRSVRRPHGQRYPRLFAVMPGYVFVPECEAKKGWRQIAELDEIKGYLRTGEGVQAPISKADIELVRRIEAKLNDPKKHLHGFAVGQRVRLTAPLYEYLHGPIGALADDGSIRVDDLPLFGRPTPMWVSADEIEAM